MKQKSGERTLLTSVVLSAPGPIVVGIGLFLGRSSTQYADFVRRTAELAAIIVSFLIYRALNKGGSPDPARSQRLEGTANAFVGGAMCLSGAAMAFLALFSSSAQKGNVIPGLAIALLGVTANTLLALRYKRLALESKNAILAAQSRLYRAKALVDGCVTLALSAVAAAPLSQAARVMDLGGSLIVAAYLLYSGIAILREVRPGEKGSAG